jgi:hypothetical protein
MWPVVCMLNGIHASDVCTPGIDKKSIDIAEWQITQVFRRIQTSNP